MGFINIVKIVVLASLALFFVFIIPSMGIYKQTNTGINNTILYIFGVTIVGMVILYFINEFLTQSVNANNSMVSLMMIFSSIIFTYASIGVINKKHAMEK
jgi:lipopolysaccharide export LptBFGC system permease protein LptF